MTTEKAAKIAELNDLCRMRMGTECLAVRTPGIAALPLLDQVNIWQRVATFKDFSEDNDPYAERDFGAFEHGSHKVFWKIDYCNQTLTAGSRDPSDTAITKRVLTIMLAQEY